MKAEAFHPHHMTNTHIMVQEFQYFEPASLQEATSILCEYGDRARVLAGGTYLLVQMKMETQSADCLVNVGNLAELQGIHSNDDGLRIGAGTPIRACRNMPGIRKNYAALADACASFGSAQIQMMGTLGGNICVGSPASDSVPALMAFDAQLVLLGPEGERVVSVQDFLLGPGEVDLRQGELLISVQLPPAQPNSGSAFVKVARVAADLAKVSVAAVLVREGDRVVDCRLSLGSVAPTVIRAQEAESVLVGQAFNSEIALQAGKAAAEEIAPIDDIRSSAWYRREVLAAVVHDALHSAWERAGAKPSKEQGDEEQPLVSSKVEKATSLRVGPAEEHLIELTVNGERRRLWVTPNELLLNVLREKLELTGSKYGCGIGECGACTVQINGMPALSCLTLAISVDGCEVQTVEGLQAPDGQLDPLQEAFIEYKGFQCGYCTPGMLMMTKKLLQEVPSPAEDDIREFLRGNRCRCTGFTSIVRAVMNYVEAGADD